DSYLSYSHDGGNRVDIFEIHTIKIELFACVYFKPAGGGPKLDRSPCGNKKYIPAMAAIIKSIISIILQSKSPSKSLTQLISRYLARLIILYAILEEKLFPLTISPSFSNTD